MDVALAVDLGGTKVAGALVLATGTVIDTSRSEAKTGPDSDAASLRVAIGSVVEHAMRDLPAEANVIGVGIGSAGPVDRQRGTVAPLNMPRAADAPLVEMVRAALPPGLDDLPIVLALDGLCIALAEYRFGAGTDSRTMLGMVVSTGIGGGIITPAGPLLGSSGNAGHIGQIEVAGFAAPGARGLDATVERIASGPNIVRWAREQGWTGDTGLDLGASYAAGDPVAMRAVRRSAAAVGSALASASALLDLDLVVIGGGFSNVVPEYIDLVTAARDETAPFAFTARAKIVRAGLSNDSPLVGAASLVLPG